MIEQDFILGSYKSSILKGSVKWSSPSNIALVKYWGKKEHQIPENPSISFTLSDCKTITEVTYTKRDLSTALKVTAGFSFDVYFEGEKNEAFKPKIQTFFKRIEAYLPFLRDYHFNIETENTFPHSSGIASSASGMSALSLCLMSIERDLSTALEMTDEYFYKKASFLARLGSGSACRSIEGELVVWGKNESTESSDLYGVKYEGEVNANFKNYQDTILLVDKGEKQVSSTVGHKLMFGHPFAKERFVQAHKNLAKLKAILASGDLGAFVKVVENEALTLHAMMMTSMPYFILMKPNTLEIINKIWKFREENGSNVCFTLDAGANVHILYPSSEKDIVLNFIKKELTKYCQNEHYICDHIGLGANQIED